MLFRDLTREKDDVRLILILLGCAIRKTKPIEERKIHSIERSVFKVPYKATYKNNFFSLLTPSRTGKRYKLFG